VVVPDEALVFDSAGTQVAVVGNDDTVSLRKVSIYRDFGTKAELRDGLQCGERVVLNLPADVGNGGKVQPQENTGDQKQQQGPQTSQAGGKKPG
jgi:multidrug efflux pump subunit AcrA (membrane-fusion protein)